MIHLDHNSTTRPTPGVIAAIVESLETTWANPSSLHRPGQAARHVSDLARESIGELIGCAARDLVITSGGTEADNLALLGSVDAQRNRNVVVTDRAEHSAIRATTERIVERGGDAEWLPVGQDGVVDVDALREILERRADEIAVVSVMWANNETGVIQPVEAIGTLCREHRVRFHTDGVQWVGKMPTDVSALPIDLMSFSAHKFHGPKGVGALYVRPGVRLTAQSLGGAQERSRRGGTENVPGIVGMGAAAREAKAWLATSGPAEQEALRDRFERAVVDACPGAVVNGAGQPRVWNTANIAFPRLEAEALLLLLSERGVSAAAGAACASGSLDPSPVLLAMNIPHELAHGSVRFSLSRETAVEEIDEAVGVVAGVVERLRAAVPIRHESSPVE